MTDGEVIAKSERTPTRCARYFFQVEFGPDANASPEKLASSVYRHLLDATKIGTR
jgi:hypothetical protein